jgi:hypothetical protein
VRRAAVLGGLVSAALGAVGAVLWTWWPRLVLGTGGWGTVGDGWLIVQPSRYVAAGAYPYLYTPYVFKQVGWPYPPGAAVVFAPVAWVIDHYQLSASEPPNMLGRPSAWPVLAVGLVAVGALTGAAVAALARRVAGRFELSAAVLLLPAGAISATLLYGHGEDLLAMAALVTAVGAAVDARWRRAGALVGLALLCKQWAIVLVPLLVAAAPHAERRAVAVRALLVPTLPVAVCLVADPVTTVRALTAAVATPTLGHAFPWVPPQQFAAAPLRVGGLVALGALGWRWGRRAAGHRLVAAAGLLLALRLLSEPVLFSYYLLQWTPFVLVLAAARHTRPMLWAHGLCLGALGLWWAQHPSPWLWWPVAVALAAPGVAVLVRAWRDGEITPEAPTRAVELREIPTASVA